MTQEEKIKILKKIDVFFGPHKFRNVFRAIVLFSAELHRRNLWRYFFRLEEEPLFDQILSFILLDKQLSLKYKAKIPIYKSAVLMGTIDQSKKLKEGEVFIQIRTDAFLSEEEQKIMSKLDGGFKKQAQNQHEQIIEGYVLITKNPCSHPGDI